MRSTGRPSWVRTRSGSVRRRTRRTPIEAYSLTVTPAEHSVSWRQDAFGNHVARVSFPRQLTATALTFEVGLVADLAPNNPFDFFVHEDAERWPFALRGDDPARPGAVPGRPAAAADAAVDPAHRGDRARADGDGRVPRRAQRDPRRADRVHDPRRVRRPDTRADARAPPRLLSRQLVAAGRAAARARPGRPLHVRLPRPARARAGRCRTRSTCTPGPRRTSRAPAGSAWTRPRGCSPARATSRSPARRRRRARRR